MKAVTDPEHTSSEHTVVEAVLKADSTGYWVKHPFVNSHLQRTLARWAFKLCTAGGFTLPAFALADDGYLVLHNGRHLQRLRLDSGMERDHQPRLRANAGGSLSDPDQGRSAAGESAERLPPRWTCLMRHLEQAEVLDGRRRLPPRSSTSNCGWRER